MSTQWRWGTIGAALLGAALVTAACGGSSEGATDSDDQRVAVKRGDILVSVTSTGSVSFPNQRNLTFGSSGTVERVLVEEGAQVREGQVLASLDLSDLRQAVARAEANLTVARDALSQVLPSDPTAMARAQEAVTSTRAAVKAAADALDTARTPYDEQAIARQREAVASARAALQAARDAASQPFTSQEIKRQEEAVASARVSLKAAQDAVRDPFTAQEVKRQEEAVASARVAAQSAQDALDLARQSSSPQDLAALQTDVQLATETLANARTQLPVTEAVQARLVREADETLTARRDAYRAVMLSKYGLSIADADIFLDPTTIVSRARPPFSFPAGDPQAAWVSLIRARDDLDSARAAQPTAVTAARRAVRQAEAALKTAQEALDDARAGPDALTIALHEAKVATAEANLKVGEDTLAEMLAGGKPEDSAVRRAKLATTEANLEAAQDTLAEMLAGGKPEDSAVRRAKAATAEASLHVTEDALADMLAAPDPAEVALREAKLATARVAQRSAEEDLRQLTAGGDPVTLAQRRVQVQDAELALSQAKDRLAKGAVKAPYAGVVARVSVKEGDTVAANATALLIVDPRQLEVQAIVDEVDVLRVQEGQTARISLETLPGVELEGQVKYISLLATRSQGIVSYNVTVSFQAPSAQGPAGQGAGAQPPEGRRPSGQGPPGQGQAGQPPAGQRPFGQGPSGQGQGAPPPQGQPPAGQPPAGQPPAAQGPRLQGLFREGLTTLVTIVILEQKDVLLIPARAISLSGQDRVVRVAGALGKATERVVRLGQSDGQNVEVLEGVAEGETVLVAARAQAPRLNVPTGGGGLGGVGGGGGFGGGGGGGGGPPPGR